MQGVSNAAAFIEKTDNLIAQEDCFQQHTHSLLDGKFSDYSDFSDYDSTLNCSKRDGYTPKLKDCLGGAIEFNFGAPRVGSETRPINYTINLWLRTA